MDFAFLIHSRTAKDVQKKFPLAKHLPKKLIELWCLYWPTVVVSKIVGFKTRRNKKEVTGWLIGIPMTAKQMLNKKRLAEKKVLRAIRKAERLGAEIVGLGALTSSVTNGGQNLIGKTKASLTTGNALTVATSLSHLKQIVEKYNFRKENLIIAIVGATGSIGQALSILIVKNKICRNILLLGRTEKHMEELLARIKPFDKGEVKIETTLNNIKKTKKADIILVTTSSNKALLKSKHLKHNAIVYDITQPQNLSRKVRKERPDVEIIDGGLVRIKGLKKSFPLGMGKNKIFACLAETLTLALENKKKNFAINKFNYKKAEKIKTLAAKNNIFPNILWK